MYTQILPPVNPSYIMPFDSAAAFLERSHVLELQSQMDEEERLFNMASDEAVDITLMMKILEWEDKIVPWNILAIEEEAKMHNNMLAREEAAEMEVNQKRVREAFDRRAAEEDDTAWGGFVGETRRKASRPTAISGPTFSPKYTSA